VTMAAIQTAPAIPAIAPMAPSDNPVVGRSCS
jgi:hypothetical protein